MKIRVTVTLNTKRLIVNKPVNKIEMVNKKSLDDEDDVIITSNSSNKKHLEIRQEAEYPSKDLGTLVESPQMKKFRAVSKMSGTVGKNTLISSLPVGLRETSYFDNIDQWRTLLGEKKAGSHEKITQKGKDPQDASLAEWELNLETDYDFE